MSVGTTAPHLSASQCIIKCVLCQVQTALKGGGGGRRRAEGIEEGEGGAKEKEEGEGGAKEIEEGVSHISQSDVWEVVQGVKNPQTQAKGEGIDEVPSSSVATMLGSKQRWLEVRNYFVLGADKFTLWFMLYGW